jgi:hypothetical protein
MIPHIQCDDVLSFLISEKFSLYPVLQRHMIT